MINNLCNSTRFFKPARNNKQLILTETNRRNQFPGEKEGAKTDQTNKSGNAV